MARRIRSSFGVMLFYAAIGADYVLFERVADTNYFLWYLSQGSLISLSTAFLTTIVNDLDRDTGLVSAHPGYYYAGCLWVLALVTTSVRTNLHALLLLVSDGGANDAETSVVSFLWNVFAGLAITGLLGLLVLLWFVVVAPIQYFVFLIAGAPVRMGLSGRRVHAVYKEVYDPEQRQTIQTLEETEGTAGRALDITFTRKPVTMTSTIAALLLWLTNAALSHVI